MYQPEFDSDDMSVVIVTLNISETNATINGSLPKSFINRPDDDKSINNIIFGIGMVVVILFILLIVIKLIHKCYKMYKEEEVGDDDDKNNQNKKSPLLPSTSVVRRNSSLRNPTPSIHRSSLDPDFLIEIQQRRLSQTFSNTPPLIKKP